MIVKYDEKGGLDGEKTDICDAPNLDNYIQFWQAIDESKKEGHDPHENLRNVMESKKILIGDSIPNVEVWEKIKKNILTAENPPTPSQNPETTNIDMPMDTDEHLNLSNNKPEDKNMLLLTDEQYLWGIEEDKVTNETVFKIILDNVCNGHELILHILDGLVDKISDDVKCSECYGNRADSQIKVDLCPMFKRYSDPKKLQGIFSSKSSSKKLTKNKTKKLTKNKMRLVHELIEIQNERGDDKNIKKIFKHPVIELLILKKWEDKKLRYYSSVQRFMLFVFLFTFFVRLRILESNEINTYSAKISEYDFNFTVRMAELKLDKFSNNTIIGKVLEHNETANLLKSEKSNESTRDIFRISDYINSTFTANLFKSNNTSNMTGQFMKSYDNGHFKAKILEFDGDHSVTSPWLKFFKNKKENIYFYLVVMLGIIMSQVLGVFLDLVVNAEDPKIRNHNILVHVTNISYLVLGNVVCFVTALDDSFCLKFTLWFFFIRLSILEIVQLSVLVFKPASKYCTNKTTYLKNIVRKRYWKDPENYLEILFLISVPLAMLVPDWGLFQPKSDEEGNSYMWKLRVLCRGFIAVGVFSAWTELVIKMGNVSHSVVGDFIKMFYNIIKNKLFSYMQVCILLITAFSLAFWVILEGQTEEDANFATGFWFSQVLTTTMGTGEFNTGDFYKSIQGNEVTKVFAMVFLIGLICLITITMINLLVAAIINDYNLMKDEVDEENLYFIAEYIIECEKRQRAIARLLKKIKMENRVSQWILLYFRLELQELILKMFFPSSEGRKDNDENDETMMRKEFTLVYCSHSICTKSTGCKKEQKKLLPIPRTGSLWYNPEEEANERNFLLVRLLRIRGGNKTLCVYHKNKKDEREAFKTETETSCLT